MANRLKNMRLTSVDLVRNGANQEADICLFKSADPDDAPVQPTTEEKNIFKRFLNWLKETTTEEGDEPAAPIEKADDLVDVYKSAIIESLQSITSDESLSAAEKNDMIAKSMDEYHEAMLDLIDLAKADPEEGEEEEEDWEPEEDPEEDDEPEEDEDPDDDADIDDIEEV